MELAQINVLPPRMLAGRDAVGVWLSAGGVTAKAVTVGIQCPTRPNNFQVGFIQIVRPSLELAQASLCIGRW
jgi:hypothetical protein